MRPRISMITLGVNDMEASVKFYKDGLGFPQMESPPEVAFFTLNGSWLGLYGRESLAEDAEVSAYGKGFNGFSLAHNVTTEAEVDKVLEQALNAGATLSKAARKTSWGGYSGYFQDPDGYLWEVAYNPFFWVGPKDEEI
ncbi:MAG: VOC family protein [Sulfurimonadaceae bacterium]